MKSLVSILLAFFICGTVFAGNNETYLKDYVEFGMKNNLDLQAAHYTLETYKARVDQSFSNFLPKVNATGRFTKAGGGREFDFPLRSMFQPLFPQPLPDYFQDIKAPFMLPQEQDTKLEIVQPIFNWAIYNGYNASDNQYESAKYQYSLTRLNVTSDIMEAYYNYAKAYHVVGIRRSAVSLTQEAYDISTKLYQVDKAPKSDVLRSEVALRSAQQDLKVAENNLKLAGNYFNNLLNRNLDTKINYDSLSIEELSNTQNMEALKFNMNYEEASRTAVEKRPEIKQLKYTLDMTNDLKKTNYSDYLPNVSLVVDLGITGVNYLINNDTKYWTVNGIFQWNLFSGFQTNAKDEEIQAQINSLKSTSESVNKLILLDVKNNYTNYTNTLDQLDVARKGYESANENYSLNQKRYIEGLNPFINLLDAETSVTMSKENYILTYFDILVAKTRLEKSIGLLLEN
jgi:outer membrane protein TolC